MVMVVVVVVVVVVRGGTYVPELGIAPHRNQGSLQIHCL